MISKEDCLAWSANKTVNPQTGRKISPTAKKGVYAKYVKACKDLIQKKSKKSKADKMTKPDQTEYYFSLTVPILKELLKKKAPSLTLTGYGKAELVFVLIDPKHIQTVVDFKKRFKAKLPHEEIYTPEWKRFIDKEREFVIKHTKGYNQKFTRV